MKAIRISETGGPEVMQWTEVKLPPPGKGEVRLRHTAVGLNFIDTYHRSGLYALPLPAGLGLEAAGVIEALGEGVKGFKVGQRVAYGTGPIGAYAEARNIPVRRLVKLPRTINDETAAAMMLKGLTARYLLRATYRVKRGETILVHAAAGGVGLILCQWAKALGVKVIGTVGSADKAELAQAHGCAHVINYATENTAQRVRELTGGAGVPVVYDGVGQATLMASLDSLKPRGLLVSFGNASGPIRNFDLGLLSAKGSLFLTRPALMSYTADDDEFSTAAQELVDMVSSGKVKVSVNQRYALQDAAKAHADLQARRTTGSTVLIP
jgi:NADPH2:quinone reductase